MDLFHSHWTQIRCFSTTTSETFDQEIFNRRYLLDTAKRLAKENGKLLVDNPQAKKDLLKAVEDLEKSADAPTPSEVASDLLGDWTLIISTATTPATKDLPSFSLPDPLAQLRQKIIDQTNQNVQVTQRIRSTDDANLAVNRIDHVLEYKPPSKLQELIDNLPEQLAGLDINPLHVSQSKVVLVHKAELQGTKAKLSLQSVVLNVAGTSQQLDPKGKDVASLNLPFGEVLNAGDFETTYLKDSVRISRGKVGPVDQLRVFVRKEEHDDELKTTVVEMVDTMVTDDSTDAVVTAETPAEEADGEDVSDSKPSDGGDGI